MKYFTYTNTVTRSYNGCFIIFIFILPSYLLRSHEKWIQPII